MSETPWTPGPWKAVLSPWASSVVGPNHETICVGGETVGPSQADARLIAAAPEMAELLWRFLDERLDGVDASTWADVRALLVRINSESPSPKEA